MSSYGQSVELSDVNILIRDDYLQCWTNIVNMLDKIE